MKKLIRQLVENIYKKANKQPSELFLESLVKYAKSGTARHVDEDYLRILLKKKSYHAFLIYENLKRTKAIIELCFVLVQISDISTPIVVELTRNLKKASLGFKVSHFNDTKLLLLRGKIENHIYEIVFQIYQHSCIYKSLKDRIEVSSMSMQYFYEIVLEEIRLYESKVVEQPDELLAFYVGMYSTYLRLKIIHQIYECFRDNPKKPFEFLKLNFTSSQQFTQNIIKASARHLNNCLRSFLLKGRFEDDFGEFFIQKKGSESHGCTWETFSIIKDNIPYFIKVNVAEDILYIGRCVDLLRLISTNYGLMEIKCICSVCCNNKKPINCYKEDLMILHDVISTIDILSKRLNGDISLILKLTDKIVEEAFIKNYCLLGCLDGLKNIFLCGRADFLETLFHQLKELKKLTKRSYGYVLDTSLQDTVGYKNEFYSSIDVYLQESSSNFDNFTLFSNIPYPLSIVISKEIIFNLSKIFKFLWIIKRVEHLLRRASKMSLGAEKIRIICYVQLLNRYYFFLFEELIEPSFAKVVKTKSKRISEIQNNLQSAVLNILKKMYVDYETKLFYKFIRKLEEQLINRITKDTPFDDTEIKQILSDTKYDTPNEFIESMIFDISKI